MAAAKIPGAAVLPLTSKKAIPGEEAGHLIRWPVLFSSIGIVSSNQHYLKAAEVVSTVSPPYVVKEKLSMLEVLLLAVALSMDAFAVSIGLGAKHQRRPMSLAIMAGIYFGVFQALMPVFGYLGGKGVLGWVEAAAPWIAFLLLVLIGGKMIYESFAEGVEEDIATITHRVMLMLAIATSIDAMAAGFALTLLDVAPLLACLIIGVTTFLFSMAGVLIGTKSGTWLESKAELFGGVVLILIGLKMILF